MKQLYLIAFLILAVAVALFAIQNSDSSVVRFLGWQLQSPLVVIVLISTALGTIMAVLLSLPATLRLRVRLKEQTHRIAELEQQIQARELEITETSYEDGDDDRVRS